jgi:hypothetical protein
VEAAVYFQYGLTSDYGRITPSQETPSGVINASFQETLIGLTSYSTYHFRVVVFNFSDLTLGPDQTFTTSVGDRDGDGLPDDYELQHGLNPDNPMDASTDSDGDGFTNAQEYAAGTDPQNANSQFRITSVNQDEDGFEVTFTSVPGKKYQLQRTDSLTNTLWTSVADNLTPAGGSFTAVDETTGPVGQRFYRVVLLVP